MTKRGTNGGFRGSILSGAGILFLGAVLLVGCSQDDDLDGGGTTDAVSFTAGVNGTGAAAYGAAPTTRTTAGGDEWTTTDRVGIYMVTNGGSLMTSADVLADNVEHQPTTSGTTTNLTPTSGTPIYYPQSGNVDFMAYYPYGTVTGGKLAVTVAGQTNTDAQNALDVLYSNNAADVARSKTAVGLAFDHVLSKVTLNVTLGEGLSSFSGMDITAAVFSGMPQTATLNLQNGTLTADAAGNFDAVKATTANSPAAATFTALVVPQGTAAGRKVVITVDGSTYEGTIPNADAFVKGNHYTYPVTVKKSGIEFGAGSITDWDDANNNGSASLEVTEVLIRAAGKSFLMGSSDGSNIASGTPGVDLNATASEPNRNTNETQHWVTFTEDFYMSKYQITNTQYAAFLNAKGVQYETGISNTWINGNGGKCTWGDNNGQIMVLIHSWGVTYDNGAWKAQTNYENHPVINVTWYGAYEYAVWVGGSLPTEAQWEYACRGGEVNRPFGVGKGYELNNTLANFYWRSSWSWNGSNPTATTSDYGSYPAKTQAVGTYQANAFGLCDMHGNVWEWCSDWYSQYYGATDADGLTQGVTSDPTGATSGFYRVLRGGSWDINAQFCRSAFRSDYYPDDANIYFGFRVVFLP